MGEELLVCRVCLESAMQCVYLGAFVQENINNTYREIFNISTNLNAQEDDDLPESLCIACANELKNAFQFIRKARTSDQILRYKVSTAPVHDTNLTNADGKLYEIKEEEAIDIKEEPVFEIEESYSENKVSDEEVVNSENLESNGQSKAEVQDAGNGKGKILFIIRSSLRSDKPLICDKCGKSCSKLQDFSKDNSGKIVCKFCSKDIASMGSVRLHKIIHAGEKEFGCPLCPYSFSTNHHLQIHMTTHTGERRYECNVCGSKFARKTYLKSHLITHTGEKSYECKICGKFFPRAQSLNRHKILHGVQKLQCTKCDKKFDYQAEMSVHQAKYHSRITYTCNQCGKEYLKKDSLKMHMLSYHMKQKPYNCEMCSKSFSRRDNFRNHLKKVHDKDITRTTIDVIESTSGDS